VAHSCNPCYSGGRDQSQPQPQDPSSKKPITKKRAGRVAQVVQQVWGPKLKPQYGQKHRGLSMNLEMKYSKQINYNEFLSI
jgi:hypothetical protein